MKDLYLTTPTRADLDAIIQFEGNYYQDDQCIVDYIGKIPITTDPETGEVTAWSEQDRFNVRLLDETVNLFDGFEEVYPDVPYRVFS